MSILLLKKMKTIKSIKEKFKLVLESKISKWTMRISLVCWLISFLVLILKWSNLPPEVPFFYSLPWGERQLTSPASLLILPLAMILVFVLNLSLAGLFLEKEFWLCRILMLSTSLFFFLAMFTLLKIIFLIG